MKTNLLRIGIIIIILTCSVTSLRAGHIQSVYIRYQYVDTNKYLVAVALHRDCIGLPAPSFVTVCYASLNAGISGSINLYPVAGTGITIPVTTCTTPPPGPCSMGVGLEEWVFSDTLELPQPAMDWEFSYISPNFSFPFNLNVNAYVKARLDNITFLVNSSPAFNDTVYYIYCQNILSTINYSCTDADGDSLHYTLIGGLNGSGSCPYGTTPVIYSPPFSPTNPISSSSTATLSPTGLFQFTPNQVQTATICIKIDEFRNGSLISSFTRDDIVVTTPNTTSGLDEAEKKLNASITPNPFASQLNIKSENNELMHFILTDITRRELVKKEINHSATLEVQHLAPGIYFYHLTDDKNNWVSGKLVKE